MVSEFVCKYAPQHSQIESAGMFVRNWMKENTGKQPIPGWTAHFKDEQSFIDFLKWQKREGERIEWEYMTINADGTKDVESLNYEGRNGWSMCGSLHYREGPYSAQRFVYYFKRIKQ